MKEFLIISKGYYLRTIFSLLLIVYINPLQAQNIGTRIIGAEYWLLQDTISLSGKLITKDKKPVSNTSVSLLIEVNDSTSAIAVSESTKDGSFELIVNANHPLLSRTATNNFIIHYAGNEGTAASESRLEAKMATIEVSIIEEDNQRYIETRVLEFNDSMQRVPVSEMDVYLYAKRLFGYLPIGETWTDEKGLDRVELPAIPGGKDGTIELVARLEDTDRFGNVETRIVSNHGQIIESFDSPQRQLWTSKPPLWMLITFFVLMLAVWIHYLIVIIKLSAIKRNSKNLDINFKTH